MENYITRYIQITFDEDEQKKIRIQESKDNYKRKCASIQIFLDKDLVNAFKVMAKANGHSQAGIFRQCIENYMAGSEKKNGQN